MPPKTIDIERHNAEQVAYFEEEITRHGRLLPSHAYYVRRQVDEVLEAAGVNAGDLVLEAGCGMGRHTFEVAARGARVEGLDLSASLLTRLSEWDGDRYGLRLYEADVLDPPAELDQRFDAVIGFFILHHLPDVEIGMRGIARMVRPGGTVAFLEPNPYNPLFYVQVASDPALNFRGDRGILNMVPRKLDAAMRGAGLEPRPLRRFGFLPPEVVNRRRGPALERLVESLPGAARVRAFQVFSGARA